MATRALQIAVRVLMLVPAIPSGCSMNKAADSPCCSEGGSGIASAGQPGSDAGGPAGTGGSAGESGSVGGNGSAGGSGSAGEGGSAGGGGAVAGSGAAGGSGSAAMATQEIAAPPSYAGSVNNGADCAQEYATRGFEPVGSAGVRYPLFLYFAGTNFFLDAETFRSGAAPAARTVTEAMARRGFVALSADYDNGAVAWLSDHKSQLRCLFGAGRARSLLAAACALPNVDCELGIATWGHSQGAYVAHAAASHDARVRAVWTTGYGGDAASTLPKNRLRIVNGERDFGTNSSVSVLNDLMGFSDTECPDDGRSQCLRDDGSGWIIVRAADCAFSTADHCWFDRRSCTDNATMLEPNWIDATSDKAFALERNADWVADTARSFELEEQ